MTSQAPNKLQRSLLRLAEAPAFMRGVVQNIILPRAVPFTGTAGVKFVSLTPERVEAVSYTHLDVYKRQGPKNGIVTKAVEGLKKLKPSPLGVADDAALIQQANYEEHMHLLK